MKNRAKATRAQADDTSELTESDITGISPKSSRSRLTPMSGDGDPYKDLPLSKLS